MKRFITGFVLAAIAAAPRLRAAEGSDDRVPGHGRACSDRATRRSVEKASGYKVNWHQFDSGAEVARR